MGNLNSLNKNKDVNESTVLGYPTFYKKCDKQYILTKNSNFPNLTNNLYTIIIPYFINIIEEGAFKLSNPNNNLKWKIKTVIFEHEEILPEFSLNEFEDVEKFLVSNEKIKKQLNNIYPNANVEINLL